VNQKLLKALLDYDPETGSFTWKRRTPDLFDDSRGYAERSCKAWNNKFLKKTPGHLTEDGYITIGIFNKNYLAHKLAWIWMTGSTPDEIDHADRNKSNNKWDNLRAATRPQNAANKLKNRTNTSGFKGVFWHPGASKWMAQICVNRRSIYLGIFDCPAAASLAYQIEAHRQHGEFALVDRIRCYGGDTPETAYAAG